MGKFSEPSFFIHGVSLSLSGVLVSVSSPSLPAKWSSSNPIPSCKVCFATIAEYNYGCHACCCCGDGGTDGGVSSLNTWFCVIDAFRFASFISSCGNYGSLNYEWHKFTVYISGSSWSTRINLRKPADRVMLVLETFKVFSTCCFALLGSGRIEWVFFVSKLHSDLDAFFGVLSTYDIIVFRKVDLQKRIVISFLFYIFSFPTICSYCYTWFLHNFFFKFVPFSRQFYL